LEKDLEIKVDPSDFEDVITSKNNCIKELEDKLKNKMTAKIFENVIDKKDK
jgi:hypothetical protein